ncbi:MAG: undecaprenyldiphospho-muramoylpentapeptide beta-N-acetylglucosaminyltransferase [Clostridiales bacterium]|nr:undecaprenyldiphospho-muramoylpentapeptide beta-N-acetylglucosaminyltransferase [Clostridiales bacterium]
MKKKIVFTGGGTAGHVMPNIALMEKLKDDYEIYYIGSKNGIEKTLMENLSVPYTGISTGKLRRYFDWKNFTDPFRVIKGFAEARKAIKSIQPDICFSKGGFVSVPVVLAAKSSKIPVIIHESDMTPGLANKIAIPAATKVCCNFVETLEHLPKGKGVYTGTPIRSELFKGSKEEAEKICGFDDTKPVLLVVGGSTGAKSVNEAVRASLDILLEKYHVVHLCGKGKADASFDGRAGYKQIEYCDKEMKDMLALADIVISRAGANAICELLALKKPNILIPLSANASRGDQILNAESFKKQGFSYVLQDEEVNEKSLTKAIEYVTENRDKYIDAMKKAKASDAFAVIIDLINKTAG